MSHTDVRVEAGLPEPPAWVREELGGATGRGIRIAVIDSGWDRTQDDPRVLPGIGLVDPDDDLAMLRSDDDHDRVGHGTACIDLILRIAPDATVVPVRVFGNQLETSPGTLQAGLLWSLEQGFDLVNMSLGTTLENTLHPLYAACEKGRREGTLVVAAGHNSRSWSYPAIFENVIGVSADRFTSPYEYRYHPDEAFECEAWGVEQPVLWLGGERLVKHGTSFAAPNIAGIVALMLERFPGASLEDVREMLRRFAIDDGRPPRGPFLGDRGDDAPHIPEHLRPSAPAKPARKPRTKKAAPPAVAATGGQDKPSRPARKARATKAATPATAATGDQDTDAPAKPVRKTRAKKAAAPAVAATSDQEGTAPDAPARPAPKARTKKAPARR